MSPQKKQRRENKQSLYKVRCPYDYEITDDGRIIVEGEDMGDAVTFFAQGRALRNFIRVCHDISTSP